MEEKKRLSMKELFKQHEIKSIKISEESKVHIPGLTDYIENMYGHLESTDKGVAFVRKRKIYKN